MKIVHLETGRHLYGGARQVLYLLEGLRAAGVTNVLVCAEDSAIGNASPAADRIVAMPMRGDLDIAFAVRFRRLLEAEQPDIVHLHSRRGADVLGALAARAARCKVVLSRRVDNPEPRPFVPLKYGLYDRVIAISEAIRGVLRECGVPERKLACVRSAIEPATFAGDRGRLRAELGIDAQRPVLGVAAQLIGRKGHDVLLEALPVLCRRHPGLITVFFGKGPLEKQLRSQARTLGLGDAVVFAGFRDDLNALLPGLDVLAHPAHAEGLGVILLQAAAAGVPVVASAVGGIPEAVRDGETGLLVPPGKTQALIRAVDRLLADPALAREMGRRGRDFVAAEFSTERMVAGNLAVYRELVNNSRDGS
ncbi:MAG: glycosyltransferase family 4 protein [Gammaproteobacteria bacterium]